MIKRNLLNGVKRAYPSLVKLFAFIIFRVGLSNHTQKITFHVFEYFYLFISLISPLSGLKSHFFSIVLRDVLFEVTKLTPVFALHISVAGENKLIEVQRKFGRVLICTGHFGLSLSSHFALLGMGLAPIFVVNSDKGSRDISGFNWGTGQRVSLIDAEKPDVLFQIGLALDAPNSAIVAFVDYDDGDGLCVSPNLFSWAYLKEIPIVFMITRPRDNGLINVHFYPAPFDTPSTKDEADICAQEFSKQMAAETGKKVMVSKRKLSKRLQIDGMPAYKT